MPTFRLGIYILLIYGPLLSFGQPAGYDSFITRLTDQYKVDLAIAPELIPALDSIRGLGLHIQSLDELLSRLLRSSGLVYQVVEENKLMIRRDVRIPESLARGILRGRVTDLQSGQPLPFATIVATASNSVCNTDDAGYFLLPVTTLEGDVQIRYLGYEPQVLPITSFLSGEPHIPLRTLEVPLKEVIIVVPYRNMVQDYSSQSIQLKGYAFISENQFLRWNSERLLRSMTTYTHFSSDQGVRIRGSQPGNSVLILDDIPVYDPYHFYNIFGPYNGHFFTSAEVYKNNFPIQYGGRIDGLIRVQSDRERPDSRLLLDTDLLLTSITGELALSPKLYITGGGRLSHTGILHPALRDTTVNNFSLPGRFRDENEWSTSQEPQTDFHDLNLGITWMTGRKSAIKLFGFDSRDRLENTAFTQFDAFIQGQEVASIRQVYRSQDEWNNRGYSARFEGGEYDHTWYSLTLFYTRYEKEARYLSRLTDVRQGMTRTLINGGLQDNSISTTGLKVLFGHQFHSYSGITGGLDLQEHHAELLARENGLQYAAQNKHEGEYTLFGEYQHGRGQTWEWSAGSRITWLRHSGSLHILPHLRVGYRIDDAYSLRASYSGSLQAVQALTVENRFGRELDYFVLNDPETGLPVLRSDKFMFGAGFTSTHLSMDVEVYYKSSTGLTSVRSLRPDPSFANPAPPGEFYRLFSGEGYTIGTDISMIYKKKNWEATVLYTLSRLAERYDPIFRGRYFSPQEDRRHQLKTGVITGFGRFQASASMHYKSKAPYLSLVLLDGRDGIGTVDQGTVRRYLPPYFSMDLGLDYAFKFVKQPTVIGISLINATDHQNIHDLQHIGRITRTGAAGLYVTSQTELLGRTANVHFRMVID